MKKPSKKSGYKNITVTVEFRVNTDAENEKETDRVANAIKTLLVCLSDGFKIACDQKGISARGIW